MDRIVVPLDGSSEAERALGYGASLATALRGELRLVRVLAPEHGELEADPERSAVAEAYLRERTNDVWAANDCRVSTAILSTAAAEGVLDEAERASFVVMTAHGRSHNFDRILGGVADRVIRDAPVPAFLIPTHEYGSPQLAHVVAAVDGSTRAFEMLAPLIQLMSKLKGKLTILHVLPAGEGPSSPSKPAVLALDSALARLADLGVTAYFQESFGPAADEIANAAGQLELCAIALATHARPAPERIQYGSVATQVLADARLPLMLFGPAATRRLSQEVGLFEAPKRLAAELTVALKHRFNS